VSEKNNGCLSVLINGIKSLGINTYPELIFEDDSEFHHITVKQHNRIRTLYLGPEANEAETAISLDDPEAPIFEYPGMLFLGLALCPVNAKILMLGLGGGYIPNLFQKYLPDHHLTVVELDPMIAAVAGIYFGFKEDKNVKLIIQDGLDFIVDAPLESYDQIWLDAFGGSYVPKHLSTEQFIEITKKKISPAGLLAQNLHKTNWPEFIRQLSCSKKVFGATPLLFGGKISGNVVAFSLNDSEKELPYDKREINKAIKAFRTQIGPYNLVNEASKLFAPPYDLY
jgi:spermidine synthase